MPSRFAYRRNNAGALTAALVLTIVGGLFVFGIIKQLRPASTTELTVELTLLGRDKRPISGSEIWLIRPESRFLGTTNRRGLARLKSEVPKGRAVVIEARGATFRARREILVPNVSEYKSRILISPKEAKEGRVELSSASMETQSQKAVGEYSNALAKQSEEREKAIRTVQVQLSKRQPPLRPQESDYLRRVRDHTDRVVRSMRYSLLSRKVAAVTLRLLRSQRLYIEFKLLSLDNQLLGARLVDTKGLDPKKLPSVLTEALNPLYALRPWPNGPDRREALAKTLRIRKRPVDEITVYFNGHRLPTRESRDVLIALLPPFPERPGKALLAATGQGGLLVNKATDFPPSNLPLLWNWPEWSLARSQPSDLR